MILSVIGSFIFILGAICGYLMRYSWLMTEEPKTEMKEDLVVNQPSQIMVMSDADQARLEKKLLKEQKDLLGRLDE